MATLYITEYQKISGSGQGFQAPLEPEVLSQTVAISGSSAQSTAFKKNTYLIRVHTDAICSVLVGTNPSATTTNKRFVAGQTEYFAVTPGLVLAVISNA